MRKQVFEGSAFSRSHAIGALTAYDLFVRGNPDSSLVGRTGLTPRRSNAQEFALDVLIDGDRT